MSASKPRGSHVYPSRLSDCRLAALPTVSLGVQALPTVSAGGSLDGFRMNVFAVKMLCRGFATFSLITRFDFTTTIAQYAISLEVVAPIVLHITFFPFLDVDRLRACVVFYPVPVLVFPGGIDRTAYASVSTRASSHHLCAEF